MKCCIRDVDNDGRCPDHPHGLSPGAERIMVGDPKEPEPIGIEARAVNFCEDWIAGERYRVRQVLEAAKPLDASYIVAWFCRAASPTAVDELVRCLETWSGGS
jgi:hypothetical protein